MTEFSLSPVSALTEFLNRETIPVNDNPLLECRNHSAVTAAVRQAWVAAYLSGAENVLLCRYFTYHAKLLLKVSQAGCMNQDELISLWNDLHTYYSNFITASVAVPQYYFLFLLPRLQFATVTHAAAPDPELTMILQDFYNAQVQAGRHGHLNWGGLLYIERWLSALSFLQEDSQVVNVIDHVTDVLISINFNDLAFFSWLQDRLTSRLANLSETDWLAQLQAIKISFQVPEAGEPAAYDPNWPGIRTMLSQWITEFAAVYKEAGLKVAGNPVTYRAFIDLSAAHLAYLTRLFYEEGVHGEIPLTDLFKFITQHYRTRRQPVISLGSFGNKYYGVSQVTAAVIRDLLQKMINRINRSHFPVWVIAGTVSLLAFLLR